MPFNKISALTGAILAGCAAFATAPAAAGPIGLGARLEPPVTIEKAQIVNGRDYTRSPYVGRPVVPGARYGRGRFGGPGYGRKYGRPFGYGRPRYYGRRDYY